MHGHYDEPTFSSSSRRRGRCGCGCGVDWRPRPLDHLRSGTNHPGVGRVHYGAISRLRQPSSGLGAPATFANFYLFSASFRGTIQPVPSVVGPRVGGWLYTQVKFSTFGSLAWMHRPLGRNLGIHNLFSTKIAIRGFSPATLFVGS